MKRFLRDPLFHFLVLGAGMFVVYSLVSTGRSTPGTIVVTAGQVEHLAAAFTGTWQRPPSTAELKGLIDEWVREEIATREAMALGLDQNDTVIRRRLRQKLEFVSDDLAARATPTEADLQAYLQAHADTYRVAPRLTFSQVYLNPDKRRGSLARDAARLLAQLRAGARAEGMADPLLLEGAFTAASPEEIAKQFGDQFATALGELPAGQWQGPVSSEFGAHLVLIRERTPARAPALAEVREGVLRDWADARQREASEKFYEERLKRYRVTIEPLEPRPDQQSKTRP